PRQGQNIARPQPRRETIRLPPEGTPPPPLRDNPPSGNRFIQQIGNIRDRLRSSNRP
ncbi:hypothetical protein INO08_15405, partial [Staphylococcus aureus]|nr:hypothetical protein [Staphylococcus aureus]